MKDEYPQSLRIHTFLPLSRANGPGNRAVLWVQGCSLACPGCFNPETHSKSQGSVVLVDELVDQILSTGREIEGLTVSGGEPLQQTHGLGCLLERVRRETSLGVILFTGFTLEEAKKISGIELVLDNIDMLIAGRYQAAHRVAQGLRGSTNKIIHRITNRYTQKDIETVPSAEIILTPDGQIVSSGIDPIIFGPD